MTEIQQETWYPLPLPDRSVDSNTQLRFQGSRLHIDTGWTTTDRYLQLSLKGVSNGEVHGLPPVREITALASRHVTAGLTRATCDWQVQVKTGNHQVFTAAPIVCASLLTESLANELWPRNIDVNNIVPGPVATSTFSREDPATRSSPEELLERYKNELPAGLPQWERVKHPNEIADLALWLAAHPTGGPTGQTFSLARRPL